MLYRKEFIAAEYLPTRPALEVVSQATPAPPETAKSSVTSAESSVRIYMAASGQMYVGEAVREVGRNLENIERLNDAAVGFLFTNLMITKGTHVEGKLSVSCLFGRLVGPKRLMDAFTDCTTTLKAFVGRKIILKIDPVEGGSSRDAWMVFWGNVTLCGIGMNSGEKHNQLCIIEDVKILAPGLCTKLYMKGEDGYYFWSEDDPRVKEL
jgi:hypothetical protein